MTKPNKLDDKCPTVSTVSFVTVHIHFEHSVLSRCLAHKKLYIFANHIRPGAFQLYSAPGAIVLDSWCLARREQKNRGVKEKLPVTDKVSKFIAAFFGIN